MRITYVRFVTLHRLETVLNSVLDSLPKQLEIYFPVVSRFKDDFGTFRWVLRIFVIAIKWIMISLTRHFPLFQRSRLKVARITTTHHHAPRYLQWLRNVTRRLQALCFYSFPSCGT